MIGVEADVCDVEGAAALRSLYDQALRRLAQREYGEEELRRKLSSYAENAADVETVIAQVKQAGQLSDDRFIEAYIQSRVRRGFGPIRICAELREKGISEDELEGPLAVWKSSWLSLAKRVLEKKYNERKMRSVSEADKKSLLLTQKRFLLYRGFEPSMIQQIFDNK